MVNRYYQKHKKDSEKKHMKDIKGSEKEKNKRRKKAQNFTEEEKVKRRQYYHKRKQ